VQDNIKYSQVELGRLVMGSQRRLNKKTSWEPTALPVRNPLQTRPFGKGIQARRAELPTTNVLQTRPFGTSQQASSPKQEMPDLQAQLKEAENFGYNAANIPTLGPSNATPIQAKLTIGEPNDKYEQEADQVASQVVNQINSPQTQPSVQGKTIQPDELPPEEEEEEPAAVQTKLDSSTIQRDELPPEEEEEEPAAVQTKLTKLATRSDVQSPIIRRVLHPKGDPKGVAVPSAAKTLATQVSSAKKIQVQVGKKKLNGFQIGSNQYVGDRPYKNLSGDLPSGVTYIEYDIYPYTGKNRGSDRIVIGSDGKRYFTNNHYTDFTEF
jgi:hypothetical protein